MNENDHGIFLAGFDARRREKPSLNVKSFVSPLKVLSFAPASEIERYCFSLADAIHQTIRSKFQAAFRSCCGPRLRICRPWRGRS